MDALKTYRRIWALIWPFVHFYLYIRSWRAKEAPDRLAERFGMGWEKDRPKGQLFWLHAVSVGETVAALNLADALFSLSQNCSILITTNTLAAAHHVARQKKHFIIHAFQPLDHPKWVNRFLDYWEPDYAVMLESDFWPNLICLTAERQIPVIFASSQLSDRAFVKWQQRPQLAKAVFSSPRFILAVDEKQKQHFIQLSGKNSTSLKPDIRIAGSLKIPAIEKACDKLFVDQLKRAAAGRPVVVAASTHDTEEALVNAASINARSAGFDHFLILAPRHSGRGNALSKLVPLARRRAMDQLPETSDDSYICDSMGEMGSLYSVSDIIIIGATFAEKGGHNPVEMAPYGKPVIAGPSRFKNHAAFEKLAEAGLIHSVQDHHQLGQILVQMLRDLKAGTPLLSEEKLAHIQAYIDEACERAAKTAQLILDDLKK